MHIKFNQITDEEIGQIFGFYFYFKFLNPSIIDPSETGILTQDQVDIRVIKNLTKISKVLQALFDLRNVKKGVEEAKFNGWIKNKTKDVLEFFKKLIDVKPPEDELQVDKYTELYSKQQPIIIIRLREITEMHLLIKEHIDSVVGDDKEDEDPLRTVIKELGPDVPNIGETSVTETQLTLKNRFGSRMEQELNDNTEMYDVTKELVIKIFKVTPVSQASSQNLLAIFAFTKTYAIENNMKKLEKYAEEALENIKKLVAVGFISDDDNFEIFLKSVAAEVSNRSLRREQQQKEIVKLSTALKELKNHNKFVLERISDMERYLESCRDKIATKIKNKKKTNKPNKFSYKQLVKEGVIAESDVPETTRGKTVFYITMPELGQFQIEAKIFGMAAPVKMKLQLEDLLEKKDSGETKLELDQVTLNVVPTIILMNKHFLR